MNDLKNIFSQVKNLQKNSQEIQEKIKKIEATAETGAGIVKATVNGEFTVTKLDIDSSSLKPDELPMLSRLIMHAINEAQEKVKATIKTEVSSMTNLPQDFNQFFS